MINETIKMIKKSTILLGTILILKPPLSFAGGPETINDGGIWGAVTLQGNFGALAPGGEKFLWTLMNQTRTRDDTPKGMRFTEDLIFSQFGYQLNSNASIWLGYTHDWINTSPDLHHSFEESRPYQDFLWNQKIGGDFNFMGRFRMEERINQNSSNGPQDTGVRARGLVQVSHPLKILDGLSAYVGDEVLGYVNENHWGKQGFSENRIMSGLSYQMTPHVGMDLGYLGQYVDNITGNNLFTHNIQVNFRYKF
jgi:Protein of unknown function (DUF2490)